MRELASFTDPTQANRLAGYLVTQSIPASVDDEDGQWVVWVVEDDDRSAAENILDAFRADPGHSRYDAAVTQAKKLAKKNAAADRKIRRRQVDVTKRWSGHWWYAHPATSILIAISVIVAVICTDWTRIEPGFLGLPNTCNRLDSSILKAMYITDFERDGGWIVYPRSVLEPLKRGEIWRPMTPVFLHFGVLHILFNMMWMWQLGGAVEFVRGTRRFLLLVLLTGVISNLAQFWWSGPAFGGMSGVVFGIIGYVWMKGRTQPDEGLAPRPEMVVYSFFWLFLCMGGAVGPIANAAHLTGFIVGILLGARPVIWKFFRRLVRR